MSQKFPHLIMNEVQLALEKLSEIESIKVTIHETLPLQDGKIHAVINLEGVRFCDKCLKLRIDKDATHNC